MEFSYNNFTAVKNWDKWWKDLKITI
jgi:hypothetical protein